MLYTCQIKDEALASAATETLLQVAAAATKRFRVVEFGVSFDGVSAGDAPVDVDLLRQTTAGTASTTGVAPVEWDEAGEAALASFSHDFTVEPTAGDVLGSWQVTPNGGLLVLQYPLGREPVVGLSGRIALRATTATDVTPNASAYLVIEE